MDNDNARVLLVRSAVYQGSTVQSWEADLLEPGAPLDDDIKRDVIGARRRIIFVEGKEESLDKLLYSSIFPMVSVIPKDNCRGVEQAVVGLRSAHAVTWIRAWGIVDGDGQSAERIASLAAKGIFAVPSYSVESIYYHPWVIRRIAERQSRDTSADPNAKAEAAIDAGISKVTQHKDRMILKSATKAARDLVSNQMPTTQSVASKQPISLTIETTSLLSSREAKLEEYLAARDWASIIAVCPIRESGALDPISKAVGLPGINDYEAAVRTMLADDEEALNFVRSLFSSAYAEVSAAEV